MSSSVIPATTPVSWTAVPNGTAALPSFSFQNSQGTGIYRVSADVLGLSTAGVQRVVVDASGNVGIGTGSPTDSSTFGRIVDLSSGAGLGAAMYIRPQASATNYFAIGQDTAGTVYLLNRANAPTLFYTNNLERARIDASGNLLVGKTAASDTSGAGVYLTAAGGVYSTQTGSINYLTCYNTTASAYRFYVQASGQINATSTSITAISDESLKENIRDLETGLNEVLALKPRRFDWREETQIKEKNVAGFIAQEVAKVLPELVYDYNYNEMETKKSLKMGDMLPTLVKAIQEQQAQIESMKAEIEALKAK